MQKLFNSLMKVPLRLHNEQSTPVATNDIFLPDDSNIFVLFMSSSQWDEATSSLSIYDMTVILA